ncbi:MAG: hypothetical protein KC503_05900 [Myxococcales bacterium]|nr:hypothetical protein [Myxococcales bacterium]
MNSRRPLRLSLVICALVALTSQLAHAERHRVRRRDRGRAQVTRRFATQHDAAARLVNSISNEHGKRAYNTALAFAREHDLPVVTVTRGNQPRILVNVPSAKIAAWTQAFSKEQCFIEPFFNNNHKSKPGWSMLRIGDRGYMEYGRGEDYHTTTRSHRSAFPVSLTQQEITDFSRYIKDSPNGPWRYGGGSPPWNGQNCTNWLTYWAHPYTGVQTSAVVGHAYRLFDNNVSGRMTVMGVMSAELLDNFSEAQGKANW